MMESVRPLFTLLRGDVEEIQISGEILVEGGEGVLVQTGDALGRFPARSLLKPYQFLAATRDLSGDVAAREVPCLGSISATKDQITQLNAWYGADEARVTKLKLLAAYPMDEAYRGFLRETNVAPSVWYNSCFSKHIAILGSCERNGWDAASYLDTSHPYHARLTEVLSETLDESVAGLKYVVDGCLLPSPVLTSRQLAHLYRRLAAAPNGSRLGKVRDAMLRSPEWIGGRNRIDSELMRLNPGRLIAKEGADGLLALGILPGQKFTEGRGVLVKIAGGYQPAMAALALEPYLAEWGLKGVAEAPRGQSVRYATRAILDISPRLEPSTAVWPGDLAFRRDVTRDTADGCLYTLSSINTTVHVGAHTDAPNHFVPGAAGIDDVALDPYLGLCQVVAVHKSPHSRIYPADVNTLDVRARRVLFQTGSAPNPNSFNEDFVSLSAELVDWLSKQGVILVGIDTPSVDISDCKKLEAHHATARAGMAILEGVDLSGVKPGFYELHALPLRLKSCDASPVRAVLRPIS